jgi:hypothetical protein
MEKWKVEFVKAWFSRFEIKVTNDLSVIHSFDSAIYFLVAFQTPHNEF